MMKHAFVTGGGGDIGAAIGARAIAAGYQVVLVDQDGARAKQQATQLKGAIGLACDVSDEASVEAALDLAATNFGGVPDLVVNCAGIARFAPLMEQSLADFRRVLEVNLVSGFIVGRAAARRMAQRGSGCIVNITSINGVTPAPNSGAYPASKSGLAKLTELMAVEWGPLGLRSTPSHRVLLMRDCQHHFLRTRPCAAFEKKRCRPGAWADPRTLRMR